MSAAESKSLTSDREPTNEDLAGFLRLFRRYFWAHWKGYALMSALVFVASSSTALSAWLVRDVVNGIFVERKAGYLEWIVGLVVAVFIVKGLSTYFQTQLGARIANAIVADVQSRLFAHFLRQRQSFFDRYSSDDLTMRVNQGANSFGTILNRVVVHGSRDAATVVGLVAVMIYQDPMLTAISLLAVPVILLAVNAILHRIKSLMQQEMKTFIDLNRHTREIVQGFKVMKSYNVEPLIAEQSGKAIQNIRSLSNRVAALNTAPIPILDTMGGIGIGLTILYAGYRTVYQGYDPGAFLSFVAALLLAQDPARRLSQIRVAIRTSLVGVSMVEEVLNDDQTEVSGKRDLPAQKTPLPIRFKDVEFSYAPGVPVLKGFTLDVRPGEMVAMIGPSGAGKSTVFSLLLRFHTHQSGSIMIGDETIEDLSLTSLRDNIAYVGQSNFIFSGTLRQNLTLNRPGYDDEQLRDACEAVGLKPFLDSLPSGLDTPLGELGGMISGGQAQRLNIARAILKDAPILLLDEVTSSLDAENEELVRAYMHAQMGRKTLLVIAHRLSTIRQADRIALIEDGRVTAVGTHEEMIEKSGYYGRAASLQLIA
jgi:ATP-binding cassette subfamily B protein